MNRNKIEIVDYAGEILRKLSRGVLLTSKAGDRGNTMVIGWGHVGRLWNRSVFIAYVRKSRYTRELLDANPEFTINIPMDRLNPRVFEICGRKSGRDVNKIQECGLTLVPGRIISVPAILECPMTLECRVLYQQAQNVTNLPEDIQRRLYTVEPDNHVVYYGEILDAYIISQL